MNPRKKACVLPAFVLAACLIAASYVRSVLADVDIGISIGVPPPPVIVFQSPPDVVVIPRTRVYYVPTVAEYDMYQLGVYWYINQNGYWYRARGYRGPFEVIAHRHVPREIIVVPAEYRHHPRHPHGGPPGHMKRFKHGKGHGKHRH